MSQRKLSVFFIFLINGIFAIQLQYYKQKVKQTDWVKAVEIFPNKNLRREIKQRLRFWILMLKNKRKKKIENCVGCFKILLKLNKLFCLLIKLFDSMNTNTKYGQIQQTSSERGKWNTKVKNKRKKSGTSIRWRRNILRENTEDK